MRGILTIALDALYENYSIVANMAESAHCAAVVKADAYGLGIQGIIPALLRSDVRTFFVALMEEGIAVRALAPDASIYVLNGIMSGEEKDFAAHDLIPVLNDTHAVRVWQNHARHMQHILPAAIHIDTGLNRLGLDISEVADVDTDGLDIRLVMSHLACADTPDHWMNAEQLARFQTAAAAFPMARKSLAASDGILCGDAYHLDMVRPGAALYGINPIPTRKNLLRDVVQLSVPIVQIRDVPRKGTVGYAATHEVMPEQKLATVALGYADGFFRTLSNTGHLFYGDVAVPVVGRVSMDLITVDISALPDKAVAVGDRLAVFHREQQSLDGLAHKAGTIGYEILTALGNRFERVYK